MQLELYAEAIETVLERRGIAFTEPVAARFRTHAGEPGGLEVIVRLSDPKSAAFAKGAIIERFGCESRGDRLIIG